MATTPPHRPGIDAYAAWALDTGLRDLRPPRGAAKPQWVALLLETRQCTAAEFQTLAMARAPGRIWVPPAYAQPPRGLEKSRYCTALVLEDVLQLLAQRRQPEAGEQALLDLIERFEVGFGAEVPPSFERIAPQPAPGAEPVRNLRVVVGVIDDGLAFAHRRFCTQDAKGRRRTRMLGLWDQGAASDGSAGACGAGRLHTPEQINTWLEPSAGGHVDEDVVYAKAGYRDVRRRLAHGTHVMDLACGADAVEAKGHAHIVGVQLPPASVEDTSCASMTPHLLDGVRYVLARADACSPAEDAPCPVVINLSLGNIAGPHDGSSLLECALDEAITLRRKAFGADGDAAFHIVLPEGNGLQSRTHAWADFDEPGASVDLDLCLRPDDGTSSRLEIWMRPQHFGEKVTDPVHFKVSVQPPRGAAALSATLVVSSDADMQFADLRDANRVVARLALHARPANGRHALALLTVAPTICTDAWDYCAPSGVWHVTVKNEGRAMYGNFYVQRDDAPLGRRRHGRQGVLEDGDYRRFDARGFPELRDDPKNPCFVRRVGTLNALATGKKTGVVGGLRRKPDGVRAPEERYSAVSIPLQQESVKRARLFALTEDSHVLRGVLAAAARSGAAVSMSGTSTAAPQLARQLAGAWLGKAGAARGAPEEVADMNDTSRPVVEPSTELRVRSARRRG